MASGRLVWSALPLVVCLAAPGCGWFDNDSTSPSTPTTTETFTGALTRGGSVVFTFTVIQSGNVAVTLVSLDPSSSITLGLGIGKPSGNSCALSSSTSSASAGATAQITVPQSPGTYCVQVYDLGTLSATTTVTVTVAHS